MSNKARCACRTGSQKGKGNKRQGGPGRWGVSPATGTSPGGWRAVPGQRWSVVVQPEGVGWEPVRNQNQVQTSGTAVVGRQVGAGGTGFSGKGLWKGTNRSVCVRTSGVRKRKVYRLAATSAASKCGEEPVRRVCGGKVLGSQKAWLAEGEGTCGEKSALLWGRAGHRRSGASCVCSPKSVWQPACCGHEARVQVHMLN